MLLEQERNYGLGMDALVSVCSWNKNGTMVWAWMHWLAYALGTRTESWFGHGCTGDRMLLEQERNYGLGMDALVSAFSWNTSGIPTAPEENLPHTPRVGFVPRRNMNRAPTTWIHLKDFIAMSDMNPCRVEGAKLAVKGASNVQAACFLAFKVGKGISFKKGDFPKLACLGESLY